MSPSGCASEAPDGFISAKLVGAAGARCAKLTGFAGRGAKACYKERINFMEVIMQRLQQAQVIRQVYVDAAIRAERGQCGLAVIVRDRRGAMVRWFGRVTGNLTNNEAEYAAAIFALQRLNSERQFPLVIFSDSLILVQQMRGEAATRSPELRKKQAELRRLAQGFALVRFQHIPRERNRLADALANEVVDGQSPAEVSDGH